MLFWVFGAASHLADAQTITHQITLPSGDSWCSDSMINGLFSAINVYRANSGMRALTMNSVGMKDAEMRAVQVAQYLQTVPPSSPNWDPHQGYDTTAASLGYNIVSENLAWANTDYNYVVSYIWNDPLHIAAMLSTAANVAGVSCIYSNGWPYWTYEPGIASSSSPTPPAPPTPTPPSPPSPTPAPPTALDSQELEFLTLINNFRAENGVGPLQLSVTLQSASEWMSTDMATNNYVSHTDSLGRSTQARLAAFGYTYSPWGENIAAGDEDAQTAFNDFVSACDPDVSGNCTYEHRAIMLGGGFVAIGIARAYSATSAYGWYWTTDFGGYLDQVLSPNPPSAPVISSFVASPATLSLGQTATLSWSVNGATSISIDNGIGNISGITSLIVVPQQTTTYHITASNGSGTVTAAATVTVNQPSSPTQPPTTPTLASAIAKSSSEVDLVWSASSDATGVAGYEVIRNGTLLTQVSGTTLSYADINVAPQTTYNYSIKAFDAGGLYSSGSNVLTVMTPAASSGPPPPTPTTCPSPASGQFTGCYYNNLLLNGAPVTVRTDSQINFNWTKSMPSAAISGPPFSVKWQGYFNFGGGNYVFTANEAGGLLLSVDGAFVLNMPQGVGVQTTTGTIGLSAGQHLITVEYYDTLATPTVQVSWQQSN